MNEVDRNEVTPALETKLASELTGLLAGIPIGKELTLPLLGDFCTSLEFLLPRLLRCRYEAWKHESLDGIYVSVARKTASAAIEVLGTCILISDQTVTPFLVDITLSSSGKTIRSFRVCIGEPGGGNLGISGPACTSLDAKRLLESVSARQNEIGWSYRIASPE